MPSETLDSQTEHTTTIRNVILLGLGTTGDMRSLANLVPGLQKQGLNAQIIVSEEMRNALRAMAIEAQGLFVPVNIAGLLHNSPVYNPANGLDLFFKANETLLKVARPFVDKLARVLSGAAPSETVLVFNTLALGVCGPLAWQHGFKKLVLAEPYITVGRGCVKQGSHFLNLPLLPPGLSHRLAAMTIQRVLLHKARQYVAQHYLKAANRLPSLWELLGQVRQPVIYQSAPVFIHPAERTNPRLAICGYPFPPEDSALPPTVADFLETCLTQDNPVVVLALGSMASHYATAIMETFTAACQALDVAPLFITGWSQSAAGQSQNGLVTSYAPYGPVFDHPATKAVVAHASAGVANFCLAHGMPAVLLPHFPDQWHNAQVLRKLQVAAKPLAPDKVTVDRLVARLKTVLSPAVYAQAQEQRQIMRQADNVETTAEILLRTFEADA